jgi:Ca-activated chloride channel family protein
MRFASPLWLFVLLFVVFMFGLWRLRDKRQRSFNDKYFSKENQKRLGLTEEKSLYAHLNRYSLVLFLVFITVALARPQLGAKKSTVLMGDQSAVFLVDLSRSMLTKDVSPSRIDLMKFEIIKALKELGDIRVGLIAFAGSVDLISPLTEDLSAIEDYINSLNTDTMVVQGTEIKTALDEAKGFFKRTSSSQSESEFKAESKVIVLFSDGEDHQSDTISFVQDMTNENYVILTVGVGTEEGGYVPESYGSNIFVRDMSGQPVLSRPNFNFLREVAKSGGGSFFYLDPVADLAPKLKSALNNLDSKKQSQKDFVVENEIYQVFLCLALMCLPLSLLFWRLRG